MAVLVIIKIFSKLKQLKGDLWNLATDLDKEMSLIQAIDYIYFLKIKKKIPYRLGENKYGKVKINQLSNAMWFRAYGAISRSRVIWIICFLEV